MEEFSRALRQAEIKRMQATRSTKQESTKKEEIHSPKKEEICPPKKEEEEMLNYDSGDALYYYTKKRRTPIDPRKTIKL
jgi:hypothetical protein